MRRYYIEPPMKNPWKIHLTPDRPGGGYLLTGTCDKKVRVYGTKSDASLIVQAVNEIDALKAENARFRQALTEIASGEWDFDRYGTHCWERAEDALKGES